MGLESFKTEGPRTYSEDNDRVVQTVTNVVHVLNGTNPDTSMVPGTVREHDVVRRDFKVGLEDPSLQTRFSCDNCDRTATSFEALVKVDRLTFDDVDWYEEFMQNAIQAASEVDPELTYDDIELEDGNGEGDSEGDGVDIDDIGSSSSSGLDSFKTD